MLKTLFSALRERRSRVLETARIGIKGMTCSGCAKTIKKALLTKNGVREVYIDRDGGIASVTYDPTQADLPTLHKIIQRKGYFPFEIKEEAAAAE